MPTALHQTTKQPVSSFELYRPKRFQLVSDFHHPTLHHLANLMTIIASNQEERFYTRPDRPDKI
jgi:hypothetical protein